MAFIRNLEYQIDCVVLYYLEHQPINNIVSYFDNKFSVDDITMFIDDLQKDSNLLNSIINRI